MPTAAPSEPPAPDPLTIVRAYHEATKHHPHRYARALGHMDWSTQPDPFRRYEGAPLCPLDLVSPGAEPLYDSVLAGEPRAPAALGRSFVSQLFQDALGLTAWKEYRGSRWSLRANPSSGNLHPTEGYLVCGPVEGLCETGAVYHYAPHEHALERRKTFTVEGWRTIERGMPNGAFLVGLSSIFWRESWKYGERAYRYCQHDAGHAIGSVAIAAAIQGWETRLLSSVTDTEIAALLGIAAQDGIEAEHPDALLCCFPRGSDFGIEDWRSFRLDASAREAIASGEFKGAPNQLSSDHHEWEAIDVVAAAATLASPPPAAMWEPAEDPLGAVRAGLPIRAGISARAIVARRRSAVDMDGKTAIARDVFLRTMGRVMPGAMPFTALPWRPAIHLALFVHRVDGLAPGLYLLARDAAEEPRLRAAIRPELGFEQIAGAPAELPLFMLREGDVRMAAAGVSCGQAIAADGAFALGMIADFGPRLQACGPWFYRALHWEAGLLGQVLYLEAEASGVRATGIGCFFDDSMHQLLGLSDDHYQTLYHFTVGGPVDDPRLQTHPPYAHLAHARS